MYVNKINLNDILSRLSIYTFFVEKLWFHQFNFKFILNVNIEFTDLYLLIWDKQFNS